MTIACAPLCLASSVWFATIFTELVSLIVSIGKPQHRVLPGKSTTSAPTASMTRSRASLRSGCLSNPSADVGRTI